MEKHIRSTRGYLMQILLAVAVTVIPGTVMAQTPEEK